MVEQVIIIGSGPAAWAAAIYNSRAQLDPLVFEGAVNEENRLRGTTPLGQLSWTTEVENYPGYAAGDLTGYVNSVLGDGHAAYFPGVEEGITGPSLMEIMRQQAKNFGTRVITDDVVKCDFSRHPFGIETLEGNSHEANAIIIATGARANYLGLESERRFMNRGVSACAVCDGALPRFRDRPLVVVGGGDSAMEEATFLTRFASKVTIVHRRDKFRASQIMADRALENPKIEVKWNSVVDEVLGTDDEGVTGIRIKGTEGDSEEELEAAGFFCAIGHTPNVDFLGGQLELKENGYLKLTEPFRSLTSIEGVFAAGDVADDHYRQAITAAGSGCMAAIDAERWIASKGFE